MLQVLFRNIGYCICYSKYWVLTIKVSFSTQCTFSLAWLHVFRYSIKYQIRKSTWQKLLHAVEAKEKRMSFNIFKPISKYELAWHYVTGPITNIKYGSLLFLPVQHLFPLSLRKKSKFCFGNHPTPNSSYKVLVGFTPVQF